MTTTIDMPLGLLAVLRPASVRVLGAMGVDLALEHDRPFEDACAMRDRNPEAVLMELARAERPADTTSGPGWESLRRSVGEWAPSAYLSAA